MTEIERIESQVRSKLAAIKKCQCDAFKFMLVEQVKALMRRRKQLKQAQAERR